MRGRKSKYPSFLAELAIEVTRLRVAKGDAEAEAMAFGLEVAEAVREKWGGEQLYCPRGNHFALSQRNERMLKEFDGHNAKELAAKYQMTTRQFYSILATARASRKKNR